MTKRTMHAVIFKDAESDQWVAMCLELDVVTQGDSEEHAKTMISEAIELHLEDMTADEMEMLFQPIEGEPTLHEVEVNAPAILRA